jgi:hypothetical protein
MTTVAKKRLFLILFIVLAASGGIIGTSAYFGCRAFLFSTRGIETEATVLRLTNVYNSAKSKDVYYFDLSVEGTIVNEGFHTNYPDGFTLPVLVLPESETDVILGTQEDSLFTVFSTIVGGKVFALLVVVLNGFLIPGTLLFVFLLLSGKVVVAGG